MSNDNCPECGTIHAPDHPHPPAWNASEAEWAAALEALVAYAEQDPAYAMRCSPVLGCGHAVVYAETPYGKALCPGHIYSDAGMRELGISGVCEHCFDRMFPADEEDQQPLTIPPEFLAAHPPTEPPKDPS